MPRRFIHFQNHHYYHVYNRGVEKRVIFSDNKCYRRFLDIAYFYQFQNPGIRFSHFMNLSQEVREVFLNSLTTNSKIINIISYVGMPNHYHLLVRQETHEGIQQFIMRLSDSYTKYFNTRYKRVGPLFQGQFKSVLVKNDEQLKHLSRYIHLNPHTSHLVESFNDLIAYPWSSLSEYTSGNFRVCDPTVVLGYFKSVSQYIEFLRNNADYQRHLHDLKSHILD